MSMRHLRTGASVAALSLAFSGCGNDAERPADQPTTVTLSPTTPAQTQDPTGTPNDDDTATGAGSPTGATCRQGAFRGGACDTTVGAVRVDTDVTVASGATCVLQGTTIDGNVEVAQGGTVRIANATIDGDVQGEGQSEVTVTGGRVDGNIQLERGGTATVERVTIDGDLQAEAKTGAQGFMGNTIDVNLQCHQNDPAPTGSGNRVNGNKEGQCSAL